MKSKIHTMTEKMTAALGPVFQEYPDYTDIKQAIGLVLARVAQATPERGLEWDALKSIIDYAEKALPLFLDAEKTIQEGKAKVLAQGIDGFAELAKPEPIKEGSIGDYPSNPNSERTEGDFVPSKKAPLFVVESSEDSYEVEDAPEAQSPVQD